MDEEMNMILQQEESLKQNFLLIIPRYETYGGQGKYVMPMGILYISAYLKMSNVGNVYTLNMNHREGDEKDILIDEIARNKIDIVGLGGLSGEFIDIYRIVKLAKQIHPSLKIIVGGGIMTADPMTTMKALDVVDYGIIGEGEITIVELLKAISGGLLIESIAGIIYSQDGKYIETPIREEIIDLDAIPIPDYKGFDYEKYLETNPDISDGGKSYTQVSVIGGRSCKYNCTFCFHPTGNTYRQRSLDSIFSEIDYLVKEYPITYIALREELFSIDNNRVVEFCRRVDKYNFDWSIQLRIDSINPKLIDALKNTRCRYVFVGIESAHDQILKSMRKGINLEQIEYALDLLAQAGLSSRSGIIFGDKAETQETAMWTLDWYHENKDKYRMFIDMIIAFPGSTLYTNACHEGVIPDPVQFLKDGCPIVNISKLSNCQFDSLIDLVEEENRRRYMVKKYNENEKMDF